MINSVNLSPQSVAVNNNVLFASDRVRTGVCGPCGDIRHDTGSGLFTLAKSGVYKVDFNANITASSAGAVALAMRVNGETVSGTEMDYTVVTGGVYQSVSAGMLVRVCPGTSVTVTIANVSQTLATLAKDANIIISKVA